MKKLKRFVSHHWLTACAVLALIGVATALYGYGTTTFLSGFSAAEIQSIEQTRSLNDIANNPLWLPFKALQYFAQIVSINGAHIRYVSAFFALVIVACFYGLARKMHSERVSVLATCLFAVSSSILTVSRVATPAILLFSWVAVVYCVVWFKASKHKHVAPFIVIAVTSISLYVPGSPWFIGLLGLWFWKDVPRYWKYMSKAWSIGSIFVGFVLLAPLLVSFINNPGIIKSWLLIPNTFSLQDSLSALRDIPAAFFYSADANPAYSLGRLPIFDALTGTLLLLGLYSYREKIRLDRTIVYSIGVFVSVVLASANNNQLYLLFCMPFLYLLAAEGIFYLLSTWRSVFPRNPLAKIVGTVFMTIAVLAACSYHMNRYFLAWVNTPETDKVYSQKL